MVYKREVASIQCDPAHVVVKSPRNLKQLRNLRYGNLQNLRISRDDLFNMHEIAYDIPGLPGKSLLSRILFVCVDFR